MPDHPLFPVSVVTPEGPAFEGEAEMLIVPGAAGEIGILARHAPLVAMLKAGSTRVHVSDSDVKEFATGPGFFQVLENRAIALVDDAVAAADIDEARARRPLGEAQGEKRPRHAENRLGVSGGSKLRQDQGSPRAGECGFRPASCGFAFRSLDG